MKIVADQDIFAVEQAFGGFGDLALRPGRQISRRDLGGADALLVRSVTPVGPALLQGAGVGFVGAATSGVDHVDTAWLEENGIALAHCRGANARAVVEYCLGAMAALKIAGCIDIAGQRVGIIGAGAIGGKLARMLLHLGHEVVVCDPPLAEAGRTAPEYPWQSMADALDCDIVSLHVPLSFRGPYRTAGLLDAAAIARLRPGAVLINASRGGVVDEAALLMRLRDGPALHCALDVWANEPAISAPLARWAGLATPHIAGYSEQAKWGATGMLARQFAAHFGLPEAAEFDKRGAGASVEIKPAWAGDGLGHWRVIDQCLGLAGLSSRCKHWATGGKQDAKSFDALRRPLLARQEFPATTVAGSEYLTKTQRQWLGKAGFRDFPISGNCPERGRRRR